MPANNRLVVLMRAATNAFIFSMGTLLALEFGKLVLDLSLCLGGEVNVSDLVVAPWYELYTSDTRDSC
jgi:hypothetical protein